MRNASTTGEVARKIFFNMHLKSLGSCKVKNAALRRFIFIIKIAPNLNKVNFYTFRIYCTCKY